MKKSKIDILIIGAGASGAAAAWNLSKSKLKIACFEQGDFVNREHFSKENFNWEYLRYTKYDVNPNLRKFKSDYPINDNDSPISIANFNGVGGSTVLYSAHLPRFRPEDLKIKTRENILSDWPIKYSELKNYFELNESILGVAGLKGDPAYPGIKNLLKPVKLETSGKIMSKAFKKLNWNWWPSYSGIITSKFKKRKIGSMSDVNNSYWPEAIKNGVKLFTRHRVSKLKLDKFNKIKGVVYFDKHNIERFQEASIVILACGGIGTPRILLNSKTKYFKEGLANSSGLVGKNLMLHPLGFVEGVFDKFIESFKGPEGCCIYSHQFYGTKKKNNFKRGYSIQVLRGDHPIGTALTLKKFKNLKFGKNFHENFLKNFGNKIPIAIICEDLPDKKNFVEIDNKIKDSNGIPGVKINYTLSKNSKKMLAQGLKNGKKLMDAAGAKKINSFGPVKHTGWHIMGTAKMGINKKHSVVNNRGQTHDIKNLVIVDSSIFPTSSCINSMATTVSLSLMLTEKIKKKINNYY